MACAYNRIAFQILCDWCEKTRLSINMQKTQQMVVSKDCINDVALPVLKMNGTNIANAHSYNYLGDKLVFDECIDSKFSKVNARVFQLKSARKCKVEKLEKLQERAIRYVENNMYY